MYRIKTFNKISGVINGYLPNSRFEISDSGDDYEAALVRSADLNETALPDSLLAIARAGAGYNNIPVARCTEAGVAVFNTPGANANAVKELVICALLLSGRRINESIDWLLAQKAAGTSDLAALAEKEKKNFVGPELKGKKLGVIGLGAIGVMVANAAVSGLGMEVLGYDPYMSVTSAWHLSRSVRPSSDLGELLSECDYITLHLPLNDKTKNTVGEAQLAAMKTGAVLLNFARGGLVDSEAVLGALHSGKLGRYVTDFATDAMVGEPGVIAIPHLGASTPESEENCAAMAASQLQDYLENGNIHNSVNLPECSLPRASKYRLAIVNRNVGGMIGKLSALLAEDGVNIEHMLNKSRGDWAYTIIDSDTAPAPDCLSALAAIDGVARVRLI